MSAQSKPLIVGERIACYTILEVLQDAASGVHRWYRARAECCGLVVERKEHSIKDAARKGADCCHRCVSRQAYLNLQASYGYLERFGATRVIDRGEEPKTWRIVWDCCGKEATLTQTYLNVMKKAVADGKPVPICMECSIKRSRLLAKERERPSRASLTKAEILPLPHPMSPIQARDVPLKLTPEAAVLPPGVVPAAIAWPRPGRAQA